MTAQLHIGPLTTFHIYLKIFTYCGYPFLRNQNDRVFRLATLEHLGRSTTGRNAYPAVSCILWSSVFALCLETLLIFEHDTWNNDLVWPDAWHQTNRRWQWPTYQSSLILRYILRTICYTDMILGTKNKCGPMFDVNQTLGRKHMYFMV